MDKSKYAVIIAEILISAVILLLCLVYYYKYKQYRNSHEADDIDKTLSYRGKAKWLAFFSFPLIAFLISTVIPEWENNLRHLPAAFLVAVCAFTIKKIYTGIKGTDKDTLSRSLLITCMLCGFFICLLVLVVLAVYADKQIQTHLYEISTKILEK